MQQDIARCVVLASVLWHKRDPFEQSLSVIRLFCPLRNRLKQGLLESSVALMPLFHWLLASY
eukprot:5101595-Amphidinium_carterae.1